MNTITIIVLVMLGFFALIQVFIIVALKNIAEILSIASSGLKTIYKVDEYSHSKPTPTKMRPAPVPAPRRNMQRESKSGPLPIPPKPTPRINLDRGAPTKPTKK